MRFVKNSLLFIFLLIATVLSAQSGVEYIEQKYYPQEEAKNHALAAARYAEEAYFYSHQANNRSELSDFRSDIDTVLFYIKKSNELADLSLQHLAPDDSIQALLIRGKKLLDETDVVLRHIYPFRKLPVMQQYSEVMLINLIHAKIDFYQASLHADIEIPEQEDSFDYAELELDQHVARLDADETAFTDLVLDLEERIKKLNETIEGVREEIAQTTDPAYRAELESDLSDLLSERKDLENTLEKAANRLQEIRDLQQQKIEETGVLTEAPSDNESDSDAQFETDKHGYYNNREIDLNQPLPKGLVYRIQLGYFFKTQGQDAFHGLFPVSGEDLNDGKIRYYAGMFTSYLEASKAKDYIRKKRISDAFVVPYLDGKKINVKRAIEIEREKERAQ